MSFSTWGHGVFCVYIRAFFHPCPTLSVDRTDFFADFFSRPSRHKREPTNSAVAAKSVASLSGCIPTFSLGRTLKSGFFAYRKLTRISMKLPMRLAVLAQRGSDRPEA